MEDCKELDILTVTTTVGSRADGERLARQIIQRRLAACVQIDAGLQSFYRWEGKLCEESEWRLVIKTLPQCAGALQSLFAEHHPYQVPQFLAWPMNASPGYAQWVRSEIELPAS